MKGFVLTLNLLGVMVYGLPLSHDNIKGSTVEQTLATRSRASRQNHSQYGPRQKRPSVSDYTEKILHALIRRHEQDQGKNHGQGSVKVPVQWVHAEVAGSITNLPLDNSATKRDASERATPLDITLAPSGRLLLKGKLIQVENEEAGVQLEHVATNQSPQSGVSDTIDNVSPLLVKLQPDGKVLISGELHETSDGKAYVKLRHVAKPPKVSHGAFGSSASHEGIHRLPQPKKVRPVSATKGGPTGTRTVKGSATATGTSEGQAETDIVAAPLRPTTTTTITAAVADSSRPRPTHYVPVDDETDVVHVANDPSGPINWQVHNPADGKPHGIHITATAVFTTTVTLVPYPTTTLTGSQIHHHHQTDIVTHTTINLELSGPQTTITGPQTTIAGPQTTIAGPTFTQVVTGPSRPTGSFDGTIPNTHWIPWNTNEQVHNHPEADQTSAGGESEADTISSEEWQPWYGGPNDSIPPKPAGTIENTVQNEHWVPYQKPQITTTSQESSSPTTSIPLPKVAPPGIPGLPFSPLGPNPIAWHDTLADRPDGAPLHNINDVLDGSVYDPTPQRAQSVPWGQLPNAPHNENLNTGAPGQGLTQGETSASAKHISVASQTSEENSAHQIPNAEDPEELSSGGQSSPVEQPVIWHDTLSEASLKPRPRKPLVAGPIHPIAWHETLTDERKAKPQIDGADARHPDSSNDAHKF